MDYKEIYEALSTLKSLCSNLKRDCSKCLCSDGDKCLVQEIDPYLWKIKDYSEIKLMTSYAKKN